MDKTIFSGVIAPIVNPCFEDDTLDEGSLEQNFDRLMAAGVNGLYINGGTGDAANLTTEERMRVAEMLVPRLKAMHKAAIVHVGQTTQREAVKLAAHAKALGADAVASIPPKKPWPQIVEYYKALAAAGAPVIVYYIPGVTGMTAGMPELRMMLDIPGVIGIKMSDFNIFLLRSVMLEYPDKVVYSGFDEMLVPGLMYGADGCIGTWINLFPVMYDRIYRSVSEGHADRVSKLMNEFTAFLADAWKYGVIDTFEELMHAKGYAGRCFRRPSSWDPGKVDAETLDKLLAGIERIENEAAGM
ncbi:MAG: dihydrodipicolinate synthase family protein [Clostridia bacterium]|nr:dihydrodipicolinate synthase family protein [Clostridia bacterium]